jgi:hypothetical protein
MESGRKFHSFILLAVTVLMCSGCVHHPTIQYPPFPDQTKRVEDPAKARIYLIRPKGGRNPEVDFLFYGIDPAATGPRFDPHQKFIFVSPTRIHPMNPNPNIPWRLIGKVSPGDYLCWEETPHVFTLTKTPSNTNDVFTLDLTAGNVFYVRASMPGFLAPTPTLEPLTEEEGQELLKTCQPPDDYRRPAKK